MLFFAVERRWNFRSAFGRAILLSLLTIILLASSVRASERLMQRFDERHGLGVTDVRALAQDDRGFLWIGTVAGLVRYDGYAMSAWARRTVAEEVRDLVTGPAGQVLVRTASGRLYNIIASGVESVIGPEGIPLVGVVDATFGSDGRLWVARGEELVVRTADQRWSEPSLHPFNGEAIRCLAVAGNGHLLIGTASGVWELPERGTARRLADTTSVSAVLPMADDVIFVLTFMGEVIEIREGRVARRRAVPGRGISLARRGGTVWASFDRYLASVAPDSELELIGPDHGLPSGGPLLVDHEGGLWVGTFNGLLYYPEPRTISWNDKNGLPSAHARFLVATGEGIWVSTWQGVGRLQQIGGLWHALNEDIQFVGRPCLDREGALWLAGDGVLLRRTGGRWQRHGIVPGQYLQSCALSRHGIWLIVDHRLYLLAPGERPVPLPEPLPAEAGHVPRIDQVFEDDQARLWVARGGRICSAPADDVAGQRRPSWTCHDLRGAREVSKIIRIPSGGLWASTKTSGVFRLERTGWTQIPASRALPSPDVHGLTVSARGGIWVYGTGFVQRVVDRPALADGWEVVERLSFWHGLTQRGASDVLEQPDGALWLTSAAGVTHVPSDVRRQPAQPPRMALSYVLANGQPHDSDFPLRLPYGRNTLELRVAALSYRDRSLLRYQTRLRPDEPWAAVAGGPPILRFSDLAAGAYEIDVRASLDGRTWSGEREMLAVVVPPPWYRQWWGIALLALSIGLPLYAIYRVRLAMVEGLEHQRTQIAMDLHDEMGSGLGSIGILGALVADDHVPAGERTTIGRQIASTAGQLGTALTDIVWSLRIDAATLEQLAYYLAERGGRLFASGRPAFATDFPEAWPVVRLSLSVRHNLLLLGLEGLHNAARHSHASRVTLRIAPAGRRWQLQIEDDGRGFQDRTEHGHDGLGLAAMRRRAKEIGADIRWSSEAGSGTTVTIVFDPQARRRTWRRIGSAPGHDVSHHRASGAGSIE